MPQDELWATSARLRGYTLGVRFADDPYGQDHLYLIPTWSKVPGHGRDGQFSLAVDTAFRDFVPRIFRAVHYELTGGYARNVPRVAERELREIRESFQEGSLH